MNVNSTSASAGITTIFDLNDDCLFEVLGYFSLMDLLTVTDVSSRFRRTAQAYFAHSRFRKLNLAKELWPIEAEHLKIFKTLRLFGQHLTSYREPLIMCDDTNGRIKYQRTIISLLIQNRSENLVELELEWWYLTDEIITMLRPLFGPLQKLVLSRCYINDGSFLNMLPLWSPELRELTLIYPHKDGEFGKSNFNGLQVHFPKLTTIICGPVPDFGKDQIEIFLKLNSHLKAFHFTTYEFQENCVIRFIAEHVPDIETLDLYLHGRNDSVKYFGRLSKLKSLKLSFGETFPNFTLSVLNELDTANIQLKELRVIGFKYNQKRHARRFVQAFSKLKMLETLELCIPKLTALTIIAMCKHLRELSTLELYTDFTPTAEHITEFVRTSPKLKLLKLDPKLKSCLLSPKTCIDGDDYKKLLAIVEEGCVGRRLKIQLEDSYYTTNIPDNLSQKALSIEEHVYFLELLDRIIF